MNGVQEKTALVNPMDVLFTVGSGIYGKPRLANIVGAAADAAIIGGTVKALTGKKAKPSSEADEAMRLLME